MNKLIAQLNNFVPANQQEQADRDFILQYVSSHSNCANRTDEIAHLTASGWIVNKDYSKVLMVYHKLYDSWSWTGGHCDGNTDTLAVAQKEALEETGLTTTPITTDIFSVECLPVNGHVKNGNFVHSHLHLNVTYLLQADDTLPLTVNRQENSAVKWVDIEQAVAISTEPWIAHNVYAKLNKKLSVYKNGKNN